MARQSNALEMLRTDHKHVQSLFQRFERSSEKEQDEICREMVDALRQHTRIEEEIFYPYVRQTTDRMDLIEEASVEHGVAKDLLGELESGENGVHRDAVVKVLREYVGHHIREEEEKIFPLIEQTGVDLEALGEEMAEHQQGPRGLPPGAQKEQQAKSKRGAQKEAHDAGGKAKGKNGDAAEARFEHREEEDEQFLQEHGDELSRSTQRAKWIHEPGEKEDHPGQTLATRNPNVIKAWAEERGGRPATSPGGDPENPRVLRFDFPDYDKNLQPVSWEAWFKTFEERQLVFLHQQHMKAGNQSNFFRLDSPHREDA